MSEDNKTIAAALLQAQKSAEAVGKTSRNEFAKFNYASAESMIAECRGALHDAGLAVFCKTRKIEEAAGMPVLTSTYVLLLDTDVQAQTYAGSSVEMEHQIPIVEGKGKPMDKAMLGAATESLGYFLRDLLLIPRQEVDVSGRDDRKHTPRASRKPEPSKDEQPADRSADVEKALGWIRDCSGDPVALDECSGMIKGLGLTGADRQAVVDTFVAARG